MSTVVNRDRPVKRRIRDVYAYCSAEVPVLTEGESSSANPHEDPRSVSLPHLPTHSLPCPMI